MPLVRSPLASPVVTLTVLTCTVFAASLSLRPAAAQGFYFESWGGYGAGGVGVGIGVMPSSPLFYGVPPGGTVGGVHGFNFFSPPLGVLPPGFRDFRADYNDRLYFQYRAQIEGLHRHGVDPLHQDRIHSYLRGLSVPPLDAGPPPVAAIEPHLPARPLDGFGDFGGFEAPDATVVPLDQAAARLRDAAMRLSAALARRGEEGQIWHDYLQPDLIAQTAAGESDADLGPLVGNYDGVLANPQMRWVLRVDGFAETRLWLRRYVQAIHQADAPPLPADPPAADADEADRPEADEEIPPPRPQPAGDGD